MSLVCTANAATPGARRHSLYIGGKDQAKSLPKLEQWGISHILNVTPTKDSGIQVCRQRTGKQAGFIWLGVPQVRIKTHVITSVPLSRLCENLLLDLSILYPSIQLSIHPSIRLEFPITLKSRNNSCTNGWPFMMPRPVPPNWSRKPRILSTLFPKDFITDPSWSIAIMECLDPPRVSSCISWGAFRVSLLNEKRFVEWKKRLLVCWYSAFGTCCCSTSLTKCLVPFDDMILWRFSFFDIHRKMELTLEDALTLVKRRRPEAQPIPAFMKILQRQEQALAKKRKTISESDSCNLQIKNKKKRTRTIGGTSMGSPTKGPIGPSRGPTKEPSIGPPRGPSIGPSIGPEPPNVTKDEPSTAVVDIRKDADASKPAIWGTQPPPKSVMHSAPQPPMFVETQVETQTTPQNGESIVWGTAVASIQRGDYCRGSRMTV